jgi:hypothetical protein
MNQKTRTSLFLSTACGIAITLIFALPSQAQQVPINEGVNGAEVTQQQNLSKHPIDPQDEAIEQNLNPQTTTPHAAGQTSVGGSSSKGSVGNQSVGSLSQREGLEPESGSQYAGELPRTAGELPLLVLMGCMSLIGAAASRLVWAKSRR